MKGKPSNAIVATTDTLGLRRGEAFQGMPVFSIGNSVVLQKKFSQAGGWQCRQVQAYEVLLFLNQGRGRSQTLFV
jgi:hypothetical protein